MILDLSLSAEVEQWALVVDVLDVLTQIDNIDPSQNQFFLAVDLDVLTQSDTSDLAPDPILVDGMAVQTQVDILTQRIALGYF